MTSLEPLQAGLNVDELPWLYHKVACERVIDADTVVLRIDHGFENFSIKTIRLYGINAWEVRGEEKQKGLAAKVWLQQILEGRGCVLETIKNEYTDKYGRYLGKIWAQNETGDWLLLNDELIKLGHAVPYSKR